MDKRVSPEDVQGRLGVVISAEPCHRAVLHRHLKCREPLRLPTSRAPCHFSQFNVEFLSLVTNPTEAHQRDPPAEKVAAIREES